LRARTSTDSKLARAHVLASQVASAAERFAAIAAASRLESLSAGATPPLAVLAREDWEKSQSRGGSSSGSAGALRAMAVALALR
jgi:hypothetical protein